MIAKQIDRKARISDVQSGDTQGLSRDEQSDSESVEELASEGQYLEADAISGVEEAGDEPMQEVRTHQLRMDDVPREYLNDGSNDADPIDLDQSFENDNEAKKNSTNRTHPEGR